MPYTIPTVDQFRARFPNLSEQYDDDALITLLIDEASGKVSTAWLETDYQPAILYLTAHLLATDNTGEGEDVEIGAAGSGIKSESFGSGLSVTYGSDGVTDTTLSSSEMYGSTVWGRRFYQLLILNNPAIMVV